MAERGRQGGRSQQQSKRRGRPPGRKNQPHTVQRRTAHRSTGQGRDDEAMEENDDQEFTVSFIRSVAVRGTFVVKGQSEEDADRIAQEKVEDILQKTNLTWDITDYPDESLQLQWEEEAEEGVDDLETKEE